jgi:uncharacterized membrane protein
MEQTGCFETSAYKLQKPGNYPEESIQHLEHVESLKSKTNILLGKYFTVSSCELITRGQLVTITLNLKESKIFFFVLRRIYIVLTQNFQIVVTLFLELIRGRQK